MARPLVPMKQPPGRPAKHGARWLARLIEQGRLDRRSKPARDRLRAANLIAEDAGGWANLNNREVMLTWQAASAWVLLSVRLDRLLGGASDETDAELRWLVALMNAFRRYVELLGLKPARIEERLPTLQEYLAASAQAAPTTLQDALGSTIVGEDDVDTVPVDDRGAEGKSGGGDDRDDGESHGE